MQVLVAGTIGIVRSECQNHGYCKLQYNCQFLWHCKFWLPKPLVMQVLVAWTIGNASSDFQNHGYCKWQYNCQFYWYCKFWLPITIFDDILYSCSFFVCQSSAVNCQLLNLTIFLFSSNWYGTVWYDHSWLAGGGGGGGLCCDSHLTYSLKFHVESSLP